MENLKNSFKHLLLESDDEVDMNGMIDVLNYADLPVRPVTTLNDDDMDSCTDEEDEAVHAAAYRESKKAKPIPYLPFTDTCGIVDLAVGKLRTPLEFYKRFIDDELVQLIVEETNAHAFLKYTDWKHLDVEEFWKFLGVSLFMSYQNRKHTSQYWCNTLDESIVSKTFTEERYHQILNGLHFSNNRTADKSNLLYKIQPVLDKLNASFSSVVKPGHKVLIEESFVPIRGRPIFSHFIQQDLHKFGVKIFDFCCKDGYTFKFHVHVGEQSVRRCPVTRSVVMDVMNNYLDHGRRISAIHYSPPPGLSELLLQRSTQYVYKLLRKREHFTDIVVPFDNPFRDHSPLVRKGTKWYLRLFVYLVTQLAFVNSWRLYCDVVKKIDMHKFRRELIKEILFKPKEERTRPPAPK